MSDKYISVQRDEVLIEMACTENQNAWNELIRRYRPLVGDLSCQPHVQCCREEAESLLWECFVEAVKTYDKKRGVPPAGWIASCLRYALWNRFKRWRRQWHHEVYPPEFPDAPANADTVSSVCRREMIQQVRAALCRLSSHQRRVVEGLFFKGYSQKEMADMLHCSPQSISRTKQRSFAILKKLLQEVADSSIASKKVHHPD